jgi:DNA polymerase-3 subunit epsilon
MLATAPSVAAVMEQFSIFMARHHMVAHNASFDRRFLDAELQRIRTERKQEFACSMLVSRRVYPDAPGHSLETLVGYRKLRTSGIYHRALADAEMTAHLWISMVSDLKDAFKLRMVPFELMQQLAKVSKAAAPAFLQRMAADQC